MNGIDHFVQCRDVINFRQASKRIRVFTAFYIIQSCLEKYLDVNEAKS